MKLTIKFVVLLIIFTCTGLSFESQAQNAKKIKKKIIGIWKVEAMNKGREIGEEEIQKIRFIFQKDGRLTFQQGEEKEEKGFWKLSDDTKTILIKEGQREKEEKARIVELTKTKMVLKNPEGDQTITLSKI